MRQFVRRRNKSIKSLPGTRAPNHYKVYQGLPMFIVISAFCALLTKLPPSVIYSQVRYR